jgi:hypothetical protein
MPKEAVSVSLEEENLLWLRGRTRAGAARSVSQLLDRLVEEARRGRRGAARATSVIGTITIGEDDPDLGEADAALRAAFAASLARPARRTRPRKRRARG